MKLFSVFQVVSFAQEVMACLPQARPKLCNKYSLDVNSIGAELVQSLQRGHCLVVEGFVKPILFEQLDLYSAKGRQVGNTHSIKAHR